MDKFASCIRPPHTATSISRSPSPTPVTADDSEAYVHSPRPTLSGYSHRSRSRDQSRSRPPPSPSHSVGPPSTSQPTHTQSQSSSTTQRSAHHAQSPLDWANFMSYSTPPVHQAGPASNGMRQSGYGLSPTPSGSIGHDGRQHVQQHDAYQAFAQGISMSGQSPSNLNFQHPFQQGRQQQPHPGQHHPQYPSHSPHAQQHPLHQHQSQSVRSPIDAKGKGPASRGSNQEDEQHANDNGLTIDPDAFTRDIRFQVPSFLSHQVGGAPTFPPGGEAWSGYGAPNMFASDSGGGQQLTPGTLFGQTFGVASDSGHGYGNDSGSNGGRNVLEGLSGFMSESGWEGWDKETGGQGNTPGAGIMFYVNPNPSPSILGQKHQQQQQLQQHHQQHSQQTPQQSHQQHHLQQTAAHQQNNGTSSHPSAPGVNTNAAQPGQSNRGSIQSDHSASGQQSSSRRSSNITSPRSTTASMPTAQMFPQQTSQLASGSMNAFAPSISTAGESSASTVNIASSSAQPYAPPANTSALLSGPALPNIVGPSLTDGPGLYSTTGFDMVGVLARVAGRKDPKTVLGPVDLSCSFVVVDVRRYDSPIVYASPTFCALTGYDLPQILGRNCRYLQSPDGEVVKGSKRKYTDNVAVAHLKRMLNAGKECQASLINYRRGGIPFINLVTVVPIPWEGTDIVYHVGFQVDLVEQPNAILRNMRDGSYQVNYTVANPPQPVLRPTGREGGLGLSQDIVEIIGPRINLPGFGAGEDGGKMEWLKMVLENSDDFIHVLSLKGLFQYVSPAVRRVLEYEPEDLLNKNISDICHPSDIVPLMRELKDSTHAPADGNSARKVHLVFRIRRKSSGYVWIECTGRLHVEPGKGRKAVILSGRALSVPTLPWEQVGHHGGLAETEAWVKVSFDGLILHATSTAYELLGQTTSDITGKSLFSFLPGGDDCPPSAALSETDPQSDLAKLHTALQAAASQGARTAVSVKHQIVTPIQAVEVESVIYPPRASSVTESRSRAGSDSSSAADSDSSQPTETSGSSISGIKPSSLIVQIKLASSSNVNPDNRSIAHPPSANVFEELETTRGTSWQYELHQLRLLNRRLKEDIAAARSKGAKFNKGKKRKSTVDGLGPGSGNGIGGNANGGMGVSNGGGDMAPPSLLPEQYAAAPRHQLAPGFGLIAPGMSPYFG